MFSLNAYLHEYFSFTGLKLNGYFQLKVNLQEHQVQTTCQIIVLSSSDRKQIFITQNGQCDESK